VPPLSLSSLLKKIFQIVEVEGPVENGERREMLSDLD
jgi:hypothetical protein